MFRLPICMLFLALNSLQYRMQSCIRNLPRPLFFFGSYTNDGPRLPLHVHEARFRQSPCTAPSSRVPFPSNPGPSLASKSVSVRPCACACPSPRSPFYVRLLVCRCEHRLLFTPCAFPSPQHVGPVIHRFHAASGNTLIAVSNCRVRRTTAATVTGECPTAARTGS